MNVPLHHHSLPQWSPQQHVAFKVGKGSRILNHQALCAPSIQSRLLCVAFFDPTAGFEITIWVALLQKMFFGIFGIFFAIHTTLENPQPALVGP